MCKKKDTATSTLQRITGENMYIHDTLFMKGIFTYTGTLLTTSITYDASGTTELSKTTFQYSGNMVTSMLSYYKKNGAWNKESLVEITGYSGDNPTEIISHYYNDDGVETSQYKELYTYEGGLLKQLDDFAYVTGAWVPEESTTFTYDNKGRILQETGDTNNSYSQVTKYSYDADHMTEALTRGYFNGIYTNYEKTTYVYANSLLSGSVTCKWDSVTWTKTGDMQYRYNEAGNLVKEIDESTDYFHWEFDVTYGEGSGNYRQLVKISGAEYLLPGDPTPYPVKHTGSRFKLPHVHK